MANSHRMNNNKSQKINKKQLWLRNSIKKQQITTKNKKIYYKRNKSKRKYRKMTRKDKNNKKHKNQSF